MVRTPESSNSVVAPMIKKEIIYRLRQGEQGHRLRQIAVLNGDRHRILEAVERLHDNFDESIRIEDLAEESRHKHLQLPPEV
jgi:transcriptional regulator GlxA family with amidase domain